MKVAAVVVTRDRIEDLKKCVAAFGKMTRKPDALYIIDNDSSDGTQEWCLTQNDFIYFRQGNLGGAGGFKTGISKAYDAGYDWVWVMDDDAIPSEDSLLNLLNAVVSEDVVYNSLMISDLDEDILVSTLYDEREKRIYRKRSEIGSRKEIEGANFFNGTLFSSKVIAKFGLPLQDLFIRGDEIEYYLRMLEGGIRFSTITDSLVYHPLFMAKEVNFGFFIHYFEKMSDFKRFYFVRNLVYLSKKYKRVRKRFCFRVFCLDLIYIILVIRSVSQIKAHVIGFIEGFKIRNRKLS